MALTSEAPPLSKFKLLAFDIFGTLIDENTGVAKALQPLVFRLPKDHPAASGSGLAIHDIFEQIEASIHKEHPSLPQSQVLARVYTELAREWHVDTKEGEPEAFAQSMGEWPPFPDTVAAIQKLSRYYKLVPLTNCDRVTFDRVLSGPLKDVNFDAVYLAEDIGSYKPDHHNFDYLLSHIEKKFSVKKEELLMVAHGLGSDHVPTKELEIESAWIKRASSEEQEKSFEGNVAYKWRYDTLGDLAEHVEKDFAGH